MLPTQLMQARCHFSEITRTEFKIGVELATKPLTVIHIHEIIVTISLPSTFVITTVAAPSSGVTVSGGGTYAVGSPQQISATATSGWTFTGWSQEQRRQHRFDDQTRLAGPDQMSANSPMSRLSWTGAMRKCRLH